MPEEQKKNWAIEDMKKSGYDKDFIQQKINRIESTDTSSFVISGIPSGIPLLIYLILGLLAWIAIELGEDSKFKPHLPRIAKVS